MSQRDCGCPGLVTPTLEQLLAVARNKPLPHVRVRERRAPPARVGASLKGWLSWQLVNRQGREVRAGEGPNLILDQGLDQIASVLILFQRSSSAAVPTYFPIIRYAAVGTNSASPTASDTGLGSEVARTDTTFATETITRPSPGVYELTRFIEFDYDEANGNLTEWGFSNSASVGSNLFNRALFTDSGGDPDTVTKTDEEKLRLTYTLEVALSPVAFTAGSFAITGVGTVNGDYTLLGSAAPASRTDLGKGPDLLLFSALARGALATVRLTGFRLDTAGIMAEDADLSGVTYTDDIADHNDLVANQVAREVYEERDAYTPGSFTRTGGLWRFDTAYGNLDPIKGFYIGGSLEDDGFGGVDQRMGYAFDLDLADEFSKDDEHALTIGAPTVTWGRGS